MIGGLSKHNADGGATVSYPHEPRRGEPLVKAFAVAAVALIMASVSLALGREGFVLPKASLYSRAGPHSSGRVLACTGRGADIKLTHEQFGNGRASSCRSMQALLYAGQPSRVAAYRLRALERDVGGADDSSYEAGAEGA